MKMSSASRWDINQCFISDPGGSISQLKMQYKSNTLCRKKVRKLEKKDKKKNPTGFSVLTVRQCFHSLEENINCIQGQSKQ